MCYVVAQMVCRKLKSVSCLRSRACEWTFPTKLSTTLVDIVNKSWKSAEFWLTRLDGGVRCGMIGHDQGA